MKDNLSVKEFTEYFGVSEATFYNWKKKGIVKSFKIGGKLFIKSSEISELIKNGNQGGVKTSIPDKIINKI